MAGMKELAVKLKEDERFAKALAEIKDPEQLQKKIRESGFDVDLETLQKTLKLELPGILKDKLPGDTKLSDVLDNDGVKSGLKSLGKFF